ncbi:MAG TPA: Hint domain-containing protein [Anaerolineales bacterium]|nr:Hint domain-containing protein [Anaerolineales bacterium]
MKTFTAFMIVLGMFLTACIPATPGGAVSTPIEITAEISTVIAETPGPPPTTGPSPTPVPATLIPTLPSSTLSPIQLKYRVLEEFSDFFFCDPDYYPIAREDEMVLAQQRFPELQANQEEFHVILNRNGLSGVNTFTDDQKLRIYREHKKLNAIYFELVGDKFKFQIQTGSEGQQGSFITGTIDGNGAITIQEQTPSFPTCPICLAEGTLIDTPQGLVAVENLQTGDVVWTLDTAGERIKVPILKTSRVIVPTNHQVIHVILSDGRELWASPGHPSADGRTLGNLKVNDMLGGAQVTLIERIPYNGLATYDLLPSGGTSVYWANGILMGSTLAKE